MFCKILVMIKWYSKNMKRNFRNRVFAQNNQIYSKVIVFENKFLKFGMVLDI